MFSSCTRAQAEPISSDRHTNLPPAIVPDIHLQCLYYSVYITEKKTIKGLLISKNSSIAVGHIEYILAHNPHTNGNIFMGAAARVILP